MKGSFIKYLSRILILITSLLSFTCTPDREPTAPTEIQRPKPLGILPEAGTLAFPTDSTVNMVFDEPMNLSTFPRRFVLKDYKGDSVNGSFLSKDSVVIFKPLNPLKYATLYFAELRGRVRDANNNSIELNNEPILDDTTLLLNTWFYTEGEYSKNGYFTVYVRDKKDGKIVFIKDLVNPETKVLSLTSPDGLTIDPESNFLIISNTGKNEVILASPVDGTIIKKFTVPSNPVSAIVQGNTAYILSVNGRAISKINLTNQTIEQTFNLNFFPGKLAVSPDNSILYTFDQQTRDLVLINSNDGRIIKRIRNMVTSLVVGELKLDNASGNVYVCDSRGKKIKVLDAQGNNVSDYITFTNLEPLDLVFKENEILVIAGGTLYKCDKATGEIIKSIQFPTNIKSLCVIPTGEIIYLTLATTVVLVDYRTFTQLKEIDLISSGIYTIISSTKKFN